ncbi:MAG: sensor histidine kinase [Acetatifactor sp.]
MKWLGKKADIENKGIEGRITDADGKAESKVTGPSGKSGWIIRGLALSLVGAVLFSSFYGVFRENAKKRNNNILEQVGIISWLYQSSFLLYKDLCNSHSETQLEYKEIYLKPTEGYEWLLNEAELEKRSEEPYYEYEENADGSSSPLSEDGILWDEACEIRNELEKLNGYFLNLEGNFRILNNIYDYVIWDDDTGNYVTNMSSEEAERAMNYENYNRYFLLTFRFDSVGNVTLGKVLGENTERLRKTANEVVRETSLSEMITSSLNSYKKYGNVKNPRNCTVVFAASADSWNSADEIYFDTYFSQNGYYNVYFSTDYLENGVSVEVYRSVGIGGIIILFIALFVLLGLFLPIRGSEKPWDESKVCVLPFEVLLMIGSCFFAAGSLIERHVVDVASGTAKEAWMNYLSLAHSAAWWLVALYNLTIMTVYFFCWWYIGICGRAVRDKGMINYIKERSLIYRFFPFIKSKALGFYSAVQQFDLTQNAHKLILKAVLINAVILFVISSLWFGGFAVTVVYSALLYFFLRKYISDLQKKYSILLRATNRMAEGDLNVSIDEELGVFEPFKPQMISIQNGFRKAVDQELKSQKMKAELITNVSHDLKTPLTAIITYVNLLKEEGISEEKRREYLDVLDRKSLRLKALIEDLFEISKANTGNITLNLTEVDIISLMKQVSFEMADKLRSADLDLRMNLSDEKLLLTLDSQKTYRIYENLFGNIAKYAMKGTRVYVDCCRMDDRVIITMKNISAREITVDSAELTDRFVRGDASRNTEGSGLGLAIAKSFTQLQGGELSLEVDGDLFKVTTVWHV